MRFFIRRFRLYQLPSIRLGLYSIFSTQSYPESLYELYSSTKAIAYSGNQAYDGGDHKKVLREKLLQLMLE